MSEPISSAVVGTNAIAVVTGSAGVVIAGVNIGVGIGPIVMACMGAAFAMSYEREGNLFKRLCLTVFTAATGTGLSIFFAELFLHVTSLIPGHFEPGQNGVQMLVSFWLSYQLHRTILPASDKISLSLLGRIIKWGKEK
jgi:hypothetical protein